MVYEPMLERRLLQLEVIRDLDEFNELRRDCGQQARCGAQRRKQQGIHEGYLLERLKPAAAFMNGGHCLHCVAITENQRDRNFFCKLRRL